MKIDKKEITNKINKDEPIFISFKFLSEELLMLFNVILAKFLSKIDHIFLLNSVITILREVLINALKANAKRVYFNKIGLDINNPATYQEGMKKFKGNIIGEFDIIKDDMLKSDYYINIDIKIADKKLYIKVQNNAPILPEELERINLRIEKANKYNDFTEAYEEIEDDSEGAGLGIVLTILFLKNMGVNPNFYKIESKSKITETSLTIPEELRATEITTQVKKQIIDEIDGIPTFPENIIQLQKLCIDPESSIGIISKKIMLDPALTTDVIKLSNSAGFAPGKRIENINTAVMTIGLKNLNAILTASNARRILNDRYSHFEEIWEHCNMVAFYARNIAIKYRITGIIENAFMAGLLHDLGKIVLLAVNKKLVNKINDLVDDRKISNSTIMEEISIGISHSTIGELIAGKWNFPDYLIEAIKFHHTPLNAKDEFADLVFTVYLANLFAGIESHRYYFYYTEDAVLDRFNLLEIEKFNSLHEELKNKFKNSKTI